MDTLRKWIGSQGDWNRSEFSDLPLVGSSEDPVVQRWCVVAGGLGLILSRTSASQRSAHFGVTLQLYQILRERLRQRQPVQASPALLSDVMHEVAALIDPMSKACLKACFRASLGQVGAEVELGALPPETSAIRTTTSSAPLSTGFSADMLQQRAHALRRKLAAARSTNFADLK
jgi:hypothetical protein